MGRTEHATPVCRLPAWTLGFVMTEVPLTGGHITREVVRVGETVRRTSSTSAGFAVRVLSYLETAGYAYAPRYLGVDEQGRDVLTFIPGDITDHPGQRARPGRTRSAARCCASCTTPPPDMSWPVIESA
jgi:hypothetical protein